jgi:hypothetical protein
LSKEFTHKVDRAVPCSMIEMVAKGFV